MAFETALEIVQAASIELGLPSPTSAAGSYDPLPRQLFGLLNAAGRQLMREHEWSALVTLATITTVADQSDYTIAADFSRMVSDTHWDSSNHWRLIGPDSPQMDRWRRSSVAGSTGIRRSFMKIGTSIVRVFPTPTLADEELTYDYVSKYWARTSADVAIPQYTADTDTSIFDPDLLVKEMKWRFTSAKGLPVDQLLEDAKIMRSQLIAADLGGSVLNMGPDQPCDDFDVTAGPQPNFILSEGGDFVEYD